MPNANGHSEQPIRRPLWCIRGNGTCWSELEPEIWDSPASRAIEQDIIPMAKHYNMAIQPWAALAQGRLQTRAQVRFPS